MPGLRQTLDARWRSRCCLGGIAPDLGRGYRRSAVVVFVAVVAPRLGSTPRGRCLAVEVVGDGWGGGGGLQGRWNVVLALLAEGGYGAVYAKAFWVRY